MRIYDPRLGKFLSVDPLTREYPHAAPYSFAENGPIENIDRDGEERLHYTIAGYNKDGTAILTNPVKEDIKDRKFDWATLSWKTVTNGRVEYVIHSGVVHHGAVNGNLYSQDIDFIYDNAEDFIKKGKALTKKDVEDRINLYRIAEKVVASLENIHQEYKESRPGTSKAFDDDVDIKAAKINKTPVPIEQEMDINEIHFMQSSIKNTTGNYTVIGNSQALSNGTLNPKVLKMSVWRDANGKVWTLDHRRLAAFKLSGLQKLRFNGLTQVLKCGK